MFGSAAKTVCTTITAAQTEKNNLEMGHQRILYCIELTGEQYTKKSNDMGQQSADRAKGFSKSFGQPKSTAAIKSPGASRKSEKQPIYTENLDPNNKE